MEKSNFSHKKRNIKESKIMNLIDVELEYLLQKSGKEIFLKVLFPELIMDKDITIEKLSSKYPRYASFSINSQRTRLSKAKRIFELNKQKEVLQIILLGKKSRMRTKKLLYNTLPVIIYETNRHTPSPKR